MREIKRENTESTFSRNRWKSEGYFARVSRSLVQQERWRHAGAENRRCSWCELNWWQRDKTVCALPFSQLFSPFLLLSLLTPLPCFFLHPFASIAPLCSIPPSFPSSTSSNLPSLLASFSSSHAAHGASRAAIVQDIPSLLMVSCAHTEGRWEKQAASSDSRPHTHGLRWFKRTLLL